MPTCAFAAAIARSAEATSVRDPKTGKRRRQVIERPEADWIEVIGAAEAIVSQNVFGRVQARLAEPERLKMGHRQATYGLAGHVRCAACGRAMVGQTLQGNYRYYRCRSAFAGPKHDRCQSRYVRADRLESAVKTAVAEVLTRPEIVAAELERLRNVTEAAPQVRDEKLGMLEGERRRVLSRYQLGDVDDSFLEDELARIRREKERLAARPISLTPSPSANFDIPAICDAARAWLENAAGDDITLIAGALDLEVTASREQAELIGKLPLTTHH